MSETLSLALSGLRAAEQQATIAAGHLVNARSSADAAAEDNALKANASSQVTGRTQAVDQAYAWSAGSKDQHFSPPADDVNAVLQLQQARQAYEASAQVLRSEEKMTKEALNLFG